LIEDLIQEYDKDNDGVINYQEYLQVVLPQDNPELRRDVTNRHIHN
jgi:Ca2+-binding EF-hand superfamily protein